MADPTNCKGCRGTVRLAADEVNRILAEYLSGTTAPLADDMTYSRRLATCGECPDLQYGTTCRHCGCLVAVRAKLAEKACPGSPPRWAEI